MITFIKSNRTIAPLIFTGTFVMSSFTLLIIFFLFILFVCSFFYCLGDFLEFVFRGFWFIYLYFII